jgi:putative resolvase
MKLSAYAKQQGISYATALRWFHQGVIHGYQAPSGTVIVLPQEPADAPSERIAIYARVSTQGQKPDVERQAQRLVQYCEARGYQVAKVVKEIGSGLNDSRPKWIDLLKDGTVTRIVVEHKDRAARFGFRYIEVLLEGQGRAIEVVNSAEGGKEDMLADLTSIIYSFCARLYGQRRAKRKTEVITALLENGSEESEDATSRTYRNQ